MSIVNKVRPGAVVQFVDICSVQEALDLIPALYKLSAMVHTYNSTTRETKVGGSEVPGQPGLHKTL